MAEAQPPQRVLFICQFNRCRSATAERLFSKRRDLEVRSAGTSADALARVNRQMLDWADLIFVMEDRQLHELRDMFPAHPKLDGIICLNIPDEYGFLDAELVILLQDRIGQHLQNV